MIRIFPPMHTLHGVLYFRDALEIESKETILTSGSLHDSNRLLLFDFEGGKLAFRTDKFQFVNYFLARSQTQYHEDLHGTYCTISYFFMQDMTFDQHLVWVVSGVFDIEEGDEIRVYRMHGYFSNSSDSIGWINRERAPCIQG